MKKTNTSWPKLFLGFGILVVITGIYFIIQKEYVEGILGILIGALLLYQNREKTNENNGE